MPRDVWAQYNADWIRYLARSSYMLQQGRYVADVAYFYGQDAPLVTLRERLNGAPLEYGFDYINAPALLNLVSVKSGRLVAPSGMEYRVLQLGGSSRMMTLSVLKRMRDLVQAGLVVAGPAPVDTPSFADDAAEFRSIREQLWGADGKGRKVGNGRVHGSGSIADALAAEGVAPDVTAGPGKVGDTILFHHRALADGDFYFVNYRSDTAGPVELSFRQTGKAPELWHADSGERTPLSYRIENGRTVIAADLHAHDAFFVVFRNPAKGHGFTAPGVKSERLAALDTGWSVTFKGSPGSSTAPAQLNAGSWTDSADPAIKFYAGTATYSRIVEVPAKALAGKGKVMLNLGEVQDIADVSVNGVAVGVRWTPPYDFDVTRALKPGSNKIDIKVTNRQVNALIGESRAKGGPTGPFGGYKADAPLRPSGLVGPVALTKQE